jgi:hypothetical protein
MQIEKTLETIAGTLNPHKIILHATVLKKTVYF